MAMSLTLAEVSGEFRCDRYSRWPGPRREEDQNQSYLSSPLQ